FDANKINILVTIDSGCSFTDHSCEIPGTPHTDSSENDHLYSDTFSNKVAYELALDYFRTLPNNDEIYSDIDWLSSDLDKSTDTESSCSFSLLVKENELDYEIKDDKRSNNSNNNIKQCVITEIKDEGGHFFQRQGRGAEPFNCKNLHVDDSSKTLELLGNWILNIATSSDKLSKDILAEELFEAYNQFYFKW
ncbi:30432_t:CDS:2, partial [Racocetra persica]